MLYDLFSVKIQCAECDEVYIHKGFPANTPVCPVCKSVSYELYLAGKAWHSSDWDFQESDKETDLHLIEEYKIRLTFLLLQLKNLNINSSFPFIV